MTDYNQHNILVGNTADRTTPRQNMEAVYRLLPEAQRGDSTIIHDRAMATPEALIWYAQHDQKFISPIAADEPLQAVLDAVSTDELLAHPLAYAPLHTTPQAPPPYYGVWREHVVTHQGQRVPVRVLVVYSRSKAKLDAEKRATQLDRLLQRLAKIQSLLNQRKYKRREYTLEQIHLAQRGNPAKSLVDLTLEGEEGALTLSYQVNATALTQAQQREGRYPVVTNRWDLSADEALQRLKEQDIAEKRFAIVKGPLQVHPLWLHKDERLVSLVLVVMLALLVYCLLEYLVRQAQRQLTGRTILETFATYTVVRLQFADGSQLWTFPELSSAQSDLLTQLGFPLPQATLMLA